MNQLFSIHEGRNHAIDFMKFFAAILITNSHMVSLYPEKFSILATGGSVGDALFFFCSGFCLMMGSTTDFFNWYKRRINRIFPTIFAVAIIEIVFLGWDPTLKNVIINGGGWFVQAIFVFYAIFWFIKRYLSERLWVAFAIVIAIILVWFVFFWDYDFSILSGSLYMRIPVFFLMMLFGAALSKRTLLTKQPTEKNKTSFMFWLFILLSSIVFFYGYMVIEGRWPILNYFQILLVPVLMLVIYSFYRFCSCTITINIFCNKYVYWLLYGISACCLEIYLTGSKMFGVGIGIKQLFPLNIIITFILIFIVAYLTKVFSNFLGQTFKTERYDWKGMIKL